MFKAIAFGLAMMFAFEVVLADDGPAGTAAIGQVIDDFHAAAAAGDAKRYLGHLTDSGVFLGTDEWERWPKRPAFTQYVQGRFTEGGGWEYRSVDRNVVVSAGGDMAWFDEVILSPTNGRFRGTGVLQRQEGQWKIAHYAMSFLILNENWDEVIDLTRKTRQALAKEGGK